jgi:hypothetical protein
LNQKEPEATLISMVIKKEIHWVTFHKTGPSFAQCYKKINRIFGRGQALTYNYFFSFLFSCPHSFFESFSSMSCKKNGRENLKDFRLPNNPVKSLNQRHLY